MNALIKSASNIEVPEMTIRNLLIGPTGPRISPLSCSTTRLQPKPAKSLNPSEWLKAVNSSFSSAPTDSLVHIAHAPKGNPQETGGPGPMAPPIGVVAAGGIYTAGNWVSGQSSLHYIARALRSHALHAFQHPPLRRHALVTLGFRFEVSRLTLGSIPKLFPAKQGIQRRISRHTGNLGVAAFYCIQSNCPRVPQFFVSIG